MAHTLWCCKNIENTVWIPLLLVSGTVCLFPPKAFLSTISCIQANLLLAKVYLCASYRQPKDIHVLMIYVLYKSRHPICFLLAKWLPYIHHSYLKCLWKSVSQQAFIECLKKAFHINQYAINQYDNHSNVTNKNGIPQMKVFQKRADYENTHTKINVTQGQTFLYDEDWADA